MDIRTFKRIIGPYILIAGLIWLCIFIPAGIRAIGTQEQLSLGKWVGILSFSTGGIFLGVIFCEQEYQLITKIKKKILGE